MSVVDSAVAPHHCLPEGLWDVAAGYAAQADELLRELTGQRLPTDGEWLRRQIMLPRDVDPTWPDAAAPRKIGEGAVHADLMEDDWRTFEGLVEQADPAEVESICSLAQLCRLPVTPYRAELRAEFDRIPTDGRVTKRRQLSEVRVLDLSSLWAGPMATGLLAAAGAQVIKIDASVRPDGFAKRPKIYEALNSRKRIVDLDLRQRKDRAEFERLVGRTDLVVDSFSRRVMPNLEYAPGDLRKINPDIATLSITAFPSHVAERDWVAYGSGIHAVSGLGLVTGVPCPPLVAYPDPLTGLRGFSVALRLLGAIDEQAHAEISLLGSVAPLVEDLKRVSRSSSCEGG